MNAVQVLVDDHLRVQGLFRRFEAAPSRDARRRQEAARRAIIELEVHSRLEQEVVYPALKDVGGGSLKKAVNQCIRDHRELDAIRAELGGLDAGSSGFEAALFALMDLAERHFIEEEHTLLPAAQARLGDRLDELGVRLQERRRELVHEVSARAPEAEWLLLGIRAPAAQRRGARAARPFAAAALGERPEGQTAPAVREQITPGMIVLGRDGSILGRVKYLRDRDFLVDRMLARDVYVPYEAVQLIGSEAVTISVGGADALDWMGWDKPPLVA